VSGVGNIKSDRGDWGLVGRLDDLENIFKNGILNY
jgi:hypothetical protein